MADSQPLPQASSAVLEPDDVHDEQDHAFDNDNESYTTSITSSIRNYQYENGRRYHSFREGQYILPNDEEEQGRLDLAHHVYGMLFEGKLFSAPLKTVNRALDLGTGTGLWAINFAEQFPDAEVIANDLSPIQPRWVPENCKFEVDDFESEWNYSTPFDYIHGRDLEGSVGNYDKLFTQAHTALKPGGYFEMQSVQTGTRSDDGTHLQATHALTYLDHLVKASESFGKDLQTVATWKSKMEAAGFVDVQEKVYKLPQSPWPKDKKLKELGRYQQVNLLTALESYTYALFTRVLGWEKEAVDVMLNGVKADFRNRRLHLYTNVYVVIGRKAEA